MCVLKTYKLLRTCFCIVFVSAAQLNYAQTTDTQKHIEVLAGTSMYGRGYVNNGIHKAGMYIDSCFGAYKLIPFKSLSGYKQNFSYSANTFPGTMEVRINNQIFTPGIDYIIEPHSPKLSGTFPCIFITKEDIFLEKKLPNIDGKVLVIDDRNPVSIDPNALNKINQALQYLSIEKNKIIAIVELTDKKLTWGAADFVGNCPYITINSNKTPHTFDTITILIEQTFIKKFSTYNVCGYIEGTEKKDSLIVLTAHYDHLGMMGANTVFPGANDNASGISMLLNLIQYFSKNPPKYTIVFVALSGEEIGLRGAFHFVENSPFPLENIRFLLNIDLAGTGDEGIQIVNSTIFAQESSLLDSLNNTHNLLPAIKKRGEACISDHCPFYQKGVRSFFIYTLGGIQAYHDVYDKHETLPLTAFTNYARLLQLFIEHI